ncbi:MAG: tetratricopeptide repeat protein [Deltaproteobacteria bacterium]|nr:tetratricopeptide repeat protein [Deltaproteobacteria bacterium]
MKRTYLLIALLSTAACGGSSVHQRGHTGASTATVHVTAEELSERLRGFHSMGLSDPERPALRAGLLGYYAAAATPLIASDDYEAVVAQLANMSDLLLPADVSAGRLPPAFEQAARYIARVGAPRGDEARVLAALYLLRCLHPDDATLTAQYQEVSEWGRDARSHVPNTLERYTRLIDVWDEHARLSPAPEVLDMLARLHVERRDAVVTAFQEDPAGVMRSMSALPSQLMRLAPLDVAAVYLRYGDVASAARHVREMGSGDETGLRLERALNQARSPGEDGGDALIQLAQAYREPRPRVALGLCRLGHRRFTDDPRFAVCLAVVAGDTGRYADSAAWYSAAIHMAPDEPSLYDEALEKIGSFIERGLFDSDPDQARVLAHHAREIIQARAQRFPNTQPAVEPWQLDYLMGVLETHAGRPAEAQAHLEASIQAHQAPEAMLQLGLLAERTGDLPSALRLYRQALDLTPERVPSDALKRAEILEHLGDAYRQSGEASQATRMYQQAFSAWDGAVGQLQNAPLALAQLRRGVLLGRLGRAGDSRAAFAEAMAAASGVLEVYTTALTYLVASAPDLDFAQQVYHRALRDASLAPEWRVYLGLWVAAIAGRAHAEVPAEVRDELSDMAQGEAWWAKLAGFGAGQIDFDELSRSAEGKGQRAEAYFYEATRRLAAGDSAGGRSFLERVINTGMVSFFEYQMAQALLRTQ